MTPNMTLRELVSYAASKLPANYEIRLCIQKYSGYVGLYYEGDPVDYPSNHETIEESMFDALSWAVIRERGPNDDDAQTHEPQEPSDDLGRETGRPQGTDTHAP